MLNRYQKEIEHLQATSNLRMLRHMPTHLIELSSNDYLGLMEDEQLYNSFLERLAKQRYAFSAASSRLLTGNSQEHEQLETQLANLYQKEACLVYNSGYHANLGILPSLCTKRDLIVADKLVHASLIDGFRLCAAEFVRYPHLNYERLEKLLEQKRNKYDNVFIVTESVFSMDGDVADLAKLVELKKQFNCFLYVDEAHSVGLMGENGLGLAEESKLLHQVDLLVCPMGKAICSVGAFVLCPQVIKDYLVSLSRTFIFTTALPPVNLAWTSFIFEQIPHWHNKRQQLTQLSHDFAQRIGQTAQSQIIPYPIGENSAAVEAAFRLRQAGFHVLPIRHPTVPKGTARLRFSLNANLKLEALLPIAEIVRNFRH